MSLPLANAIAFGLMVAMLAVAAYTDVRWRKVPNWLTLPAVPLGMLFWLIVGLSSAEDPTAMQGLTRSLIGFAAGFFPALVIYSMGALGGGDVKTLGALGAICAAWEVVLGTAFYGLIIAFVMAIVLMVRRKLVKQTLSRLFGAMLIWASKNQAELDNDNAIPLGVAFKIGGILAGMEHMLEVPLPWSRWL